MGWSCAKRAGEVMDAFSTLCREQGGSSNVYNTSRGEAFIEWSRREHSDGAITGTIWNTVGPKFKDERGDDRTPVRRGGSVRIEGDGTVTRGPQLLKQAAQMVNSGRVRGTRAH